MTSRPQPIGYDEAAFSKDVISKWGDICGALIEDQRLLHPQMAHLARLCEARPEAASEIFLFLEDLLVRANVTSEIENAVAISLLDWEKVQRLGYSRRVPATLAHNQKAVGTLPVRRLTCTTEQTHTAFLARHRTGRGR